MHARMLAVVSDWRLAWGVVPVLAFVISFIVTCAAAELAIRLPATRSSLIAYGGGATRPAKLAQTQAKPGVDLGAQLRSALAIMFGPGALLNGAICALLLRAIVAPPTTATPAALAFFCDLLVMSVVGDFALYWGHRVQHEVPFLWERFHALHHELETPSPIGTLFIHPVDASLQGGLSLMLAAAVAQPHPVTFWAFVWLRVTENVLNHSGLRGGIIDVLTLKCLPLRAKVAHHDAHHKYGARNAKHAKNFGETFWVWDWAFGTLAKH